MVQDRILKQSLVGVVLCLLVSSIFSLPGCSDGFFDDPESCSVNRDCPGTQLCQSQKCVEAACQPGQKRTCYDGPSDVPGKGICKAGIQTCQADGTYNACQGQILPKAVDCNSDNDNDCNGNIDKDEASCSGCKANETRDCYTGPAATKAKGICKSGKQSCSNGKFGACNNQTLPSVEACNNGKDDDCDGKTDVADEDCTGKNCKSDNDCGKAAICVFGTGKNEGRCAVPCQKTCSSGFTCTRPFAGAGTFCLKAVAKGATCDVAKAQICPAGQFCDKGQCRNQIVSGEKAACDQFSKVCAKGLVCVFTPTQGVCTKKCTQDSNCSKGTTCVKTNTPIGNVCMTVCKASSECKALWGANAACERTGLTELNLCRPKGTLKQWDSCFLGGTNCLNGLRCYIPSAESQKAGFGYCTPASCNKSSDCAEPAAGVSKVCATAITPNTCIVPCTSNPKICNKIPGLACRSFKAGKYCAP